MTQTAAANAKQETVMDVTGDEVARGYAVAFWNVAKKSSHAGELVEELSSFATDVLDKFPKLDETLRSAIVRDEERTNALGPVTTERNSSQSGSA